MNYLMAVLLFCGACTVNAETVVTPIVVTTPTPAPAAFPEVKGTVDSIDRFNNTFQVNASGKLVAFTATSNLLIQINGTPVTYADLNKGDLVTVRDVAPGNGQIQ